jgi:aryl-alcohol dehydrogenase-like predicted oxidoreductase
VSTVSRIVISSKGKMNYRELGKTGIQVSEIGFGTWGIGGNSKGAVAYGKTDDDESLLALRTAFDLGINFYDTAHVYGFGHSQELIGKAFKYCRENIVIASKVGFLNFDGMQNFSPLHIRDTLESSLHNLQTDYIDLYQLHSPPIDLIIKDGVILNTLEGLRKQGKIRAIGISVRSPDEGVIAVKQFDFDAIQVNFNMLDQRALENGLLELCEQKKVGVIIRTPLCFGFLTGQYTSANIFDPQDHRRKWGAKRIDKWVKAYKTVFGSISDKEQSTNAQIALRFCLSYPSVSTVIPGMLTKGQVEENVLSSEQGGLNSQDLKSVTSTYKINEKEWGKIDRNN